MKDKDTAEFQNMLAALRMLGADPAPGASVGRAMARMQTTGTADRRSWAALQRLERENELLIDHAEMLACALGACPNCWGTGPPRHPAPDPRRKGYLQGRLS